MSVLETPRIYFKGEITWDPITTNNYAQNYNEDTGETLYPPDPRLIVRNAQGKVQDFRRAAIKDVATLVSWNPHGTHRSDLFNTTLCGFDVGDGLQTKDPFMAAPVNLRAMLVDVEPYGGLSSQLFFDSMVFGVDGGCRILAPRTARFADRYVNMTRTWAPSFRAGVASVIWQTSFAKADGLRIDSFDSVALLALERALQDDDVLGLTVRFNSYRTIYYDNPSLSNGSPAAKLEAQKLMDKLNSGGFQPNPARGHVVGVVGLWRKGEPAQEPGDRAMIQVGGNTVGSAFARVNGSNLVIDLANSVPEIDTNLTKLSMGTLDVLALDPLTRRSVRIAWIAYGDYNRAAYEATAGIVTVPLTAEAQALLPTCELQLGDSGGTVLLSELPVRAIPTTPNAYLDEGQSLDATFQVYDRGLPPKVITLVTLYQFDAAGGLLNTLRTTSDSNGVVTLPLNGISGKVTYFVPSTCAADNPATGGVNPQINTFMYLRVRPANRFLATLAPTWSNVYTNVLANWNAMAPCMDNWLKLNDPVQVKSYGAVLKRLTDPAHFESFRFMPVTRDMSAGERTLLYKFLDLPEPELSSDAVAERQSVRTFAERSRLLRGNPGEGTAGKGD